MPLYPFTIAVGRLSPERVSQQLDGPERARSEAATLASEVLRDADGRFWGGPEWRRQVTDEQNTAACVLPVDS